MGGVLLFAVKDLANAVRKASWSSPGAVFLSPARLFSRSASPFASSGTERTGVWRRGSLQWSVCAVWDEQTTCRLRPGAEREAGSGRSNKGE